MMKQVFKLSLLVGTASMVALLTVSYAKTMSSIPGFNLKPGDSFTVKINITDPEEFALGKLKNLGGQQDISNVFLQYIKNEGLINVTDYDDRVKYIGNASLGQAWFRFDNVGVNDTGTYSVLYKRENSADLFTTTFNVNVTKASRNAIFTKDLNVPATTVIKNKKCVKISDN
ncbi:uncharacterized protein LOC116300122 [Actinia tenebrosa]|uniref:Uncharacterized protein LOC116300122 n=1 Tax=Actinia tenebrosa TaxID=6105 RepID=A0A6P8IEU3_ACTTE|nr:uncharacterized protein LOC116300122 [Actinia tenebrosa]